MKNVSLTARIVGAIVILSLGIIFIPVLLETDNIKSGRMNESPIPEIPNEISTIIFQMNEETGKFEEQDQSSIEQFEIEVAKEIENSANEIEMSELEQVVPEKPTKVVPQSPPKVKTEQAQDKSQHSWMLQVASFKDKKKALKLRDELRAKGYVTHISERKQDSGNIWRVRIGPDLSKAKIQKIQGKLDKEMGLRGLIVRRR